MRSLFIKIFLWFWLATVLVVGALAFATMPARPSLKREHMKTMLDNLMLVTTQRVAAILDRGNPATLRRDLEQACQATGLHLFVFDETDREVLGRPLPAGMTELVKRARGSGQIELPEPSARIPLVAHAVTTQNGLEYVVVARMPPGPLSQLFASPYTLALRLAAVVAMAGVLCYGLARYLTAPLRKLRASARQLAGGDLSVRVGTGVGHRRDEIGELGRDFDYMAEQIESLVSAQRRLVRDMSHELRSPLTRLNVALELAVQRAGPDAKEALERIEREACRLNDLIAQMLVIARLEAGGKPVGRTPIDLDSLVRQIVTDADFEAGSRGKHVILGRCDHCRLAGDPELIRRAIENVVRNGIRHTASSTSVEVSLRCEPTASAARAVIHIRDHGPGVSEASIRDIFQPFYRIGDGRERQSGGAGLGLAIALQAIQSHGGWITAVNATGGGLVVEISLPAEAPPL